jgi:hypothetical protein
MDDDGSARGQTYFEGFRRSPQVALRPGWFESIVRLMIDGPGGEDHFLGVVEAHIPDDGGTTFRYQVARSGDLVRCTSLDGAVHLIAGLETVWQRREDGPDRIIERPRSMGVYPPDDYEFGLMRDDERRWVGEDFTIPTSPARNTMFLGRPAWEIELAPPPHKPEPIQIVIDRVTGLVLRQASSAFATFHEWLELDTDPQLSDDLFTWQGTDTVAVRYG